MSVSIIFDQGLGQLQLNHLSIAFVELEVQVFLNKIMRMFRPECEAKRIDLRLVMGSNLPKRLNADPTRLSQILVNLVR